MAGNGSNGATVRQAICWPPLLVHHRLKAGGVWSIDCGKRKDGGVWSLNTGERKAGGVWSFDPGEHKAGGVRTPSGGDGGAGGVWIPNPGDLVSPVDKICRQDAGRCREHIH